MNNKKATPNNLLKKLYALTENKSSAFKRILPIHKHIFWAIQHGHLQISQKPKTIDKEIAEYKKQHRLEMDQQTLIQCVSIEDVFLGKQKEKEKYNLKQIKLLKKLQQRNFSKEKSQLSLLQKQQEYKEKIKEYQKQRELIEQKKKAEQLKRIQQLKEEEEKTRIQKQKQIERQKQDKKRKLQAGLKQMEEKRRKRQEMIKQLAVEQKRSQSMKSLSHSVPKYVQLEREYLEKERRKVEEAKQLQRQKRESMHVIMQQIKSHEKQYIQKLKQKFTALGSNKKNSQTDTKPSKAKSQFNVLKQRNQQEDQKNRQKAQRRKEFQNKVRNIPIHIDINKKKQKEIQIDKAVNKQKYILLAKKHLDDSQIFNEFKDFEVKIDPKAIGVNYLNQLRLMPKAPKSQRLAKHDSQQSLARSQTKHTYINYLQELKLKSKTTRNSEPKLRETDELLRLVQRSKNILKKQQEQQQNIFLGHQPVSLKQSTLKRLPNELSAKTKENQLKKQVSKSITQKIVEYERKVLKKVNDLKKMSQYDESLKNQGEIDDLFTKVLKAKLDTIDLT